MGGKINSRYSFLNFAIAVFFFTVPIESIAIFESFSIVKIAALIVLFAWFTKCFATKRSRMIRAFIVLATYASLSVLWSIDKGKSFHQIMMFLWPSIIVVTAINYSIKSNNDIYIYLKFFIVGCLVAAIAAMGARDVTLTAAEYADQERLTAFNQDQNTLAFILCVGFTIALDFFRRTSKSLWRFTSLAICVVFILVILSTGSRTGLILAVLVLGLYFLSIRSIKNLILLILLILLLSPIVYNYVPESIWERFLETNTLVKSGNFSGRGDIWLLGLKAFSKENIILGVGYSNFSTMIWQHFGWQIASHNTYLSYIVDLGIIGFVIFFFVLSRMCQIVYLIYKSSKDIYIFAYVIPFLCVMFVLETEYKRWLFILGIMLESYYQLNYTSYNIKYTKIVKR